LIEARTMGEHNQKLQLSDNLISAIFKQMNQQQIFFSYDNGQEFLKAVNCYEPDIFYDPEKLEEALTKASEPESDSSEKYDESIAEKCREFCKAAEDSYEMVAKILPSIRNSQKVISRYQKDKKGISLIDLHLAKETFIESRDIYEKHAGLIANGWAYICNIHQKFPEQIDVIKIYIKYLAKLLASREARYPSENYLLFLANGEFDFEIPDFEPTDTQLQHGKTRVSLAKEYIETLRVEINRLECRYRKRKLMAKVKENTPKSQILKELMEIAHIDPIDIRTHILLARMFAEYASSIKNLQKRQSMREQALRYCNKAFGRIDQYLDLQNIEKARERDQQRMGFVKTISAIRIPLVKKR
ncbi:MAG: hypothetical protein GY866_38160, partial [Proteobacteria bacterium]|nr:hypothetical protein [Pseudomonadota bacterium]